MVTTSNPSVPYLARLRADPGGDDEQRYRAISGTATGGLGGDDEQRYRAITGTATAGPGGDDKQRFRAISGAATAGPGQVRRS